LQQRQSEALLGVRRQEAEDYRKQVEQEGTYRAAMSKRAEREIDPEYIKQRYGYQPQSLGELEELAGYEHPVRQSGISDDEWNRREGIRFSHQQKLKSMGQKSGIPPSQQVAARRLALSSAA